MTSPATTATPRERFDPKTPNAQQMRDNIVHGAFLTEGTMVAFPPCFPGMSVMPPTDECRIEALDITPSGIVYAATSGYACRLLVGMFHGVTGVVFDMGLIPNATQSVGVAVGEKTFLAAANGSAGGVLVHRKLQPLPFDLIQEWHFNRYPIEAIPLPGNEPIVHLLADSTRKSADVLTTNRLLRVEFETLAVQEIAKLPGRGRMARWGSKIVGFDENNSLWTLETPSLELKRRALELPDGDWTSNHRPITRDNACGRLYLADDAGKIFALEATGRFTAELARVPVAPVGPMAVTNDGRLFGAYGEGMGMLFTFEPDTGRCASLGVAVSTFERRRYGYTFADAVIGRDGEVIFGENDNLGHLWLYFPRIKACK